MPARRDRAGRGGGRTTIADVAARAGVSTATVSRVLAGVGTSRPETRRRVRAAARDLAYRPSRVARSLRIRATRTIGLIVTDIANPYFPEIIRAVEDAARRLDYAILLCNGGEDSGREAAYLELLAERRVDAIIVASSGLTGRHARRLRMTAVPVALVNCRSEIGELPAILSDNRGGARLAAEHLLALGHRAIGHVAGPASNAATAERIAGVRDALAGAGLDPDALTVAHGDGHAGGATAALDELLDRSPGTTAIVCYNDLTAAGVVGAARSRGLDVPADLSVVGFDDIELGRHLDPPLTTVAQDMPRMGRWAVERLAAELASEGPGPDAEVVCLPVELRVRGSTSTPRVRARPGSPRGLRRVQHVSLPIPDGEDALATGRWFYGELLGLEEVPRPPALPNRGLWFAVGDQELHLFAESSGTAANDRSRRHPCFQVDDVDRLRTQLEARHVPTHHDDGVIPGRARFFAVDPWGNTLEFVRFGADRW